MEDTSKLQKDIDQLGKWARKWGIRFQPVKCNIMQLTRKQIKKINAVYSLEGRGLENVDNIKYFVTTFKPQIGTVGISIPWHFKCHVLELTFISTVSSQTPLGIGMHSLHLQFPLLKVLRTSSLLRSRD